MIGDRIREMLELRHMSQSELARRTGIPKTTINSIITRNNKNMDYSMMERIAEALDAPVEYFQGREPKQEERSTFPKGLEPIRPYRMKIYGPVAAGVPITAAADEEEYVDLPCEPEGRADGLMRVEGDSMEPRYLNGDLVLIREQEDVEDGQIAAVCIDDRVTLKKVYHIPNGVYLVSENTKYAPMTYTLDEANNIHLIGLAVGFMRWEH